MATVLPANRTFWSIKGRQEPRSRVFNLLPFLLTDSKVGVQEGFSSSESMFTQIITNAEVTLDNRKGTFSKRGNFPIMGSEIIYLYHVGGLVLVGYVEASSIQRIPITPGIEKLKFSFVTAYNFFKLWYIGRRSAPTSTNQGYFASNVVSDYRKFWARFKATMQEKVGEDWQDIVVYMNPLTYYGLGGNERAETLLRAEFDLVHHFDTDNLDYSEVAPCGKIDPPLPSRVFEGWNQQDQSGATIKQWDLTQIAKRKTRPSVRSVEVEKIIAAALREFNHYVPEGASTALGGLKNRPSISLGTISPSTVYIEQLIELIGELHHVELFRVNPGSGDIVIAAVFPREDYSSKLHGRIWPTGYCTFYKIQNKTEIEELDSLNPPWEDNFSAGSEDGWEQLRLSAMWNSSLGLPDNNVGMKVFNLPTNKIAVYTLKRKLVITPQGSAAYFLAHIFEYDYVIGQTSSYKRTSDPVSIYDNKLRTVYHNGTDYAFQVHAPDILLEHILNLQIEKDCWSFSQSKGNLGFFGNIFFDRIALDFDDKTFADLLKLLGTLTNSVPNLYNDSNGRTTLDFRDRESKRSTVYIPKGALLDDIKEEVQEYVVLEDLPEINLNEVKISEGHKQAIRRYYFETGFRGKVILTTSRWSVFKLDNTVLCGLKTFNELKIGGISRPSRQLSSGEIPHNLGVIQNISRDEFVLTITTRRREEL